MPHSVAKLFEDVLLAIGDIENFCEGKDYADFEVDRQLQAAVERELEVIGEALFRLRGANQDVIGQIPDAEKIIGLRNILAHGYDVLDYDILWDVVTSKLSLLKQKIAELQSEAV